MNLLVNFFEDCNEGIMGKETEGRGVLQSIRGWMGGGGGENPLRFSLNDGMILWKLWNTYG